MRHLTVLRYNLDVLLTNFTIQNQTVIAVIELHRYKYPYDSN